MKIEEETTITLTLTTDEFDTVMMAFQSALKAAGGTWRVSDTFNAHTVVKRINDLYKQLEASYDR